MDWSHLFSSIVLGVLIAIPIWIVYILIKIKILDWKNK